MIKELDINPKAKAKREYKFKEEKTVFEQAVKDLLKKQETTNYLLGIVAMLLLGIFLRLVLL